MGKCVSKQTSAISIASADLTTTSSNNDFRRCSASSDYVPIRTDYGHSTNNEDDCGLNNEGQSESKKKEKRQGPETKGTAMSFGFRKKLQTPKKSKNPQFKEKEKQTTTTPTSISSSPEAVDQEKYQSATVISNPGLVTNEDLLNSDKNGNAGPESTSDRRPTPQIVPSKRDTGITNNTQQQHRANRFGFRSTNIVRPASAGITPKLTDFQENVENNNFTDKRRSKSASATHTRVSAAFNRLNDQQSINENKSAVPKINAVSVNNSENLRHQQQEKKVTWEAPIRFKGTENTNRQYHVINTGMHTNVIVKPTPQPAVSVSRFTLHTASLPKPQYPVPISLTNRTTMDCKNAKQVANNNRKGFFGPREVSADSGISSLDNTFDNGGGSPRRSRNRPRNLEMVISGRHKFEVRDLDDTLSCDSVEPLLLPKLPSAFSSDIQTVPLCGLVRTNTVLSRDDLPNNNQESNAQRKVNRNHSDAESVEEEKLFRDRSTSEKETKNPSLKDYTTSSKNSSPGSSRASWCNAGESLAVKDCSSLSLSSSDESKDVHIEKTANIAEEQEISTFTISEKPSLLSSLTETVPKCIENEIKINERPATLSHIAESKFAEMAAAVSDVLLDDETSPTDSLVSSTESDDVLLKKAKKKANEETQEKDIDEISPELELSSPLSPGTPTHASNSLSLSDVGRDFLIDDEIADQPALLFSDKADGPESIMLHHSLTDTPTLIETGSNKSAALNSSSKAKSKAHAAIEHILRTPLSLRKATLLNRAESLDTLSPCESIASDDLMMDFESHSSMDSIDRMSVSMRSRCESAFQALDDAQLLSELESKGTEMIREWNNILRVHRTGRESIISQLPARATRLLNRSRLQQSQLSNAGSDSPKSGDSLPRRSSRASSLHLSSRDANSSSDDLFLHDKSFRNSMIQDVLYFKKQLIRLRRVLQEDEESLTRTDTLNPFDFGNGQFFGSCGIDSSNNSDEKDLGSLTSATNEDPLQELADLRRQVVYLQGQVEDRDRTIRLQKNVIEKLEIENQKIQTVSVATSISEKECVNSATQTERVRPLSIGQEGLARSKPECTSYAAYLPATASTTISPTTTNQTSRRHTIISTTFTNLNHVSQSPRRASIGWEKLTYKPVKTTLIGEPINSNIIYNNNNSNNNSNNNNELVNKSNTHFERSTTKQVNGISRNNINTTSNNSINQQNTAKKIVQQQQQSQKFIEINKCHLDKKSKFEDLKTEHHSPSVTIV